MASNFNRDKMKLLGTNRSKKGKLGAGSKAQGNTLLSLLVSVFAVYVLLFIF